MVNTIIDLIENIKTLKTYIRWGLVDEGVVAPLLHDMETELVILRSIRMVDSFDYVADDEAEDIINNTSIISVDPSLDNWGNK